MFHNSRDSYFALLRDAAILIYTISKSPPLFQGKTIKWNWTSQLDEVSRASDFMGSFAKDTSLLQRQVVLLDVLSRWFVNKHPIFSYL